MENLASLNGMYEVRSRSPRNGELYKHGPSLFSFLSQRDSPHDRQGAHVHICAMVDGEGLDIRLLDKDFRVIDEARLLEAQDFDFSRDDLTL